MKKAAFILIIASIVMIVVSQTVDFKKKVESRTAMPGYSMADTNYSSSTYLVADKDTPKYFLYGGLGLFVIGGLLFTTTLSKSKS